MPRKLVGFGVALLVALAVGVGGADGRSLDTTTVLVEVIGSGQVTGGGGQIGCGAGLVDCYATYVSGTSVTLTAVAAAGWTFDSWDGCSSATGTTCTVDLDGSTSPHEPIANFVPSVSPGDSTLTVSVPLDANGDGGEVADTNGMIDCGSSGATCSWTNLTGSTITVLETPDDGYQFNGWGGACSGTAVSCTVTLSSDQSLTASFSQSSTSTTLSVSVTGNGTVSGGGIACTSVGGTGCTATEAANSTVTLTATPAAGSGFAGWGGACAGTATSCVVTMDSAQSVTAAFSGGSSGGATEPLVVAVVGDGTVTGGGVDCGGSATTCTVNVAAGSAVTLTASAATGATFTGWSGACTGTHSSCTLTVAAPTSVTATFSGSSTGGGSGPQLNVSVQGPGRVTGGGIDCGGGATTCSAVETKGRAVTLTAAPQSGAVFDGWAGACHGTAKSCRIVPNGSTTVSATFTAAGAPPPPPPHSTPLLRSRGKPIVHRTRTGFTVTLRFRLARGGSVSVLALRAGRAEALFSFSAAAGPATVGPFPLAKAGFYRFQVAVAGGSLHWTSCLGRCGAGATKTSFAFARRPPDVTRAGTRWSVALRFRSTVAAGIELRVYRRGVLTRDVRFPVGSGVVKARPVLLSPGGYSFKVVAIDAYGRVRSLTWVAVLP